MILEIYDRHGNLKNTVQGDERICMLNVEQGDTYKEVDSFQDVQMYTNEQIAKIKRNDSRKYRTATITVKTSTGKTFDGDEDSQNRMMRAIKGAELLSKTSTLWKLTDNTKVQVTLDELKEALALAMEKQSNIWMEA